MIGMIVLFLNCIFVKLKNKKKFPLLLLLLLSCSSHSSNKNVLSNFRNESKLKDGSFILAGRSFEIVGPQTLIDLGPNVGIILL